MSVQERERSSVSRVQWTGSSYVGLLPRLTVARIELKDLLVILQGFVQFIDLLVGLGPADEWLDIVGIEFDGFRTRLNSRFVLFLDERRRGSRSVSHSRAVYHFH